MKVFLILFLNIIFINSQTITDKQLTFVKKIHLDSSLIVGNISDIYCNDNIIIVGEFLKTGTHIFNLRGKLIKTLDFEECKPGSKASILTIDKNEKTLSVVSGDYPSLYIFDNDGKGIKAINLKEFSSRIRFYKDEFFITSFSNSENIFLEKYDLNGNKLKSIKRGDNRFAYYLSRLVNYWLLLINDNKVIVGDLISYKVDIYEHNLKKSKELGHKPKFYKAPNVPKNKKPKTEHTEIINYLKEVDEKATIVSALNWYDDNHILLQYIFGNIKNQVGIQIINIHNNKLVYENVIKGTKRFHYVYDKMLINVEQPEPNKKTGDLPNPELVFYKINL